MDVVPAPARDGGTVTLALMLHNASTSVAAGNIAIEAIHDRSLPQPLPIHRQVVYMGPDALVEVSFEVPRVSMASSPYTFFAMVDVFNEIEEADESNNAAWQRIAVCGDPEGEEVADGFDNDCDGLTDEGLGLPADTGDALEMLRASQRRAALDSAPLVYATPRFPEGFARWRTARLASEEGQFIAPPTSSTASPRGGGGRRGNRGGGRRGQNEGPAVGDLSATASAEDPIAELRLTDWNGGDLVSGDPISLQDRNGAYVVADIVRNGRLVTREESRQREHLFTVIKVSGDTAAGTGHDPMIRSGDQIALVAPSGRFLHAEGGGGGPLRANRESISGWETFTLTLGDQGEGGSR